MKTKQLLSVLSALFIAGCLLAQTQGGPDAFGYIWKNQAAVGGPVYTWNDIKATGTQITGLGDDNSIANINLNWYFRYYWTDYNKITVGSNGWIGFTGSPGNIAAPFPPLPSTLAKNTVDPLLCDLTFTKNPSGPVPGATAWYWTNNVDIMIIQYDSVPFWVNNASGYSGRNTFQIILSGADSSVTFQYKLQQNGTPPYDLAGEGLYTGIVNSSGQIGLQVLGGAYPSSTTAVKFYYPNPVTYQVFDATPAWNQNVDNGGFFVSANGVPENLTTDVANAGNQPIANIGVAGELFDVSLSQVWTSSSTVTSLAAGADTLIVYPSAYTASVTGTFLYRSTSTLAGDMNSANDITDVEMVVVDTTTATIALSYVTPTTPSTQSSWGGNGGQGIYIEPPFYPATITSLDFMIGNSGTTGYHLAQILDDNGPGNTPGTILYLDSVAASAAVPLVYNNVPVTTPVVINSGGVYVSWLENGDSLSGIGTDATLPLSNRNYEIIGGSWANYRNNSVDDIMIQVNINDFGDITTSYTPDGCPSDNSGTITVNVAGGTAPFTYSWSTSPVQTTATATGLPVGSYTVIVTDAHGAIGTAVGNIYSPITVSTVTVTNVTCFGGNDGDATMTSAGGTSPYTYSWNPSGQTTATATGLSAGNYTVTSTDALGCSNVGMVTLTSPTMIVISATTVPSGCAGGNGSSTATASGGTGPYTYLWSTTPAQTTAIATGLSAGSYTILITDAVGCTKSSVVTITSTPFNISSSSTAVSCFNGNNGTATATATSGGTAPYTYLWTPSAQNTQTATGLSAGTYTVLVTDAAGCTKSTSVVLTNPTLIFTTVTSSPCTTCPTTPNGSATTSGTTGGTGPYAYAWSPGGQTTASITGQLPGTYTVCVTDSKGCTNCFNVTIVDNTAVNEIYSGASIVISPNPFNSSAQVKIDFVNPVHSELMFTVYDIYGREIQSIDLSDLKGAAIDFTLNRGYNIPNGLYFYRLKDHEGILSAGKLIVQ